jgi:hypothetical protein
MKMNSSNIEPTNGKSISFYEKFREIQKEGCKFRCLGLGCIGTSILLIIITIVIYFLLK